MNSMWSKKVHRQQSLEWIICEAKNRNEHFKTLKVPHPPNSRNDAIPAKEDGQRRPQSVRTENKNKVQISTRIDLGRKYLQHAVTCLVVASFSHRDEVVAQNESGEFRVLLVDHAGAIAGEFDELLSHVELQHQVAVLYVEGVVKQLEGAAKHAAGGSRFFVYFIFGEEVMFFW